VEMGAQAVIDGRRHRKKVIDVLFDGKKRCTTLGETGG